MYLLLLCVMSLFVGFNCAPVTMEIKTLKSHKIRPSISHVLGVTANEFNSNGAMADDRVVYADKGLKFTTSTAATPDQGLLKTVKIISLYTQLVHKIRNKRNIIESPPPECKDGKELDVSGTCREVF